MAAAKKNCHAGSRLPRLRLARLIGSGQAFHVGRSTIGPEGLAKSHGHDFAEVFWIEGGRGLHVANGRRVPIEAGALVFVRPSDRHGFRGEPGAPLSIMNVAFPAAALRPLGARHPELSGEFFWSRAALPASFRVDDAFLHWLAEEVRDLAASTGSTLCLDRFLLGLFLRLEAWRAPSARPAPPEWLLAALRDFRAPAQFERGTAGLAELAGRSPEHVNRELRRHFGATATAAVNRARMRWAAEQLRFTDRSILEVALDCGCGNLGHFYKLFRAEHGRSPAAWRRRQHREAVRFQSPWLSATDEPIQAKPEPKKFSGRGHPR